MADNTTHRQPQRFNMNAFNADELLRSLDFSSAIASNGLFTTIYYGMRDTLPNMAINLSKVTEPLQHLGEFGLAEWFTTPSYTLPTPAELSSFEEAMNAQELLATVSAALSQGVDVSQATRPSDSISAQADAAFAEFRKFYDALADEYERALSKARKSTDRKLQFARGEGAKRLAEAQAHLNVQTAPQVAQLRRMLTGLRQIANATTELPGRGSLLVRLVTDLERRLARFQFTQPALSIVPTTTVAGHGDASLPAIAA